MVVRPYSPSDWERLCEIHDEARKQELQASGLSDAFIPLAEAAGNEGLFDGEVLVAERDGTVCGFVAYNAGELTWLYVEPRHQRRGVARYLVRAVRRTFPGRLTLEVLLGNEAALALYLGEGFQVVRQVSGKLAGNEAFPASANVLFHDGDAGADR